MPSYQPASCNIGRRQRKRRLAVAVVGFAAAVGYVGAILGGYVPESLLVGAFVPLAIGFEWGFQAVTSFCVRLALLNRYDFRSDGGGSAGSVTEPSNRRADHEYAAKITVAACASAGVSTAVLWLLV